MNQDESRRMTALDAVLRLRGHDPEFDADEVAQEAAVFERYLRDGPPLQEQEK